MFTELPVSSPEGRRTNTRWTFLISFAAEAIVVAAIVLAPLINIQALPKLWLTTSIVVWAPEPPPVPTKPTIVPGTIHRPTIHSFHIPVAIPPTINTAPSVPPPQVEPVPGVLGAVPGVGPGPGELLIPAPTPKPPAPPAVAPRRIRMGGNVEAAKLIYPVPVVYPAFARAAGIQGSVVLEAIIAVDGTVKRLQYVSGPPLLVRAAMDAVRQWRYQPTLLNGQPVEVQTTITINFSLHGPGS